MVAVMLKHSVQQVLPGSRTCICKSGWAGNGLQCTGRYGSERKINICLMQVCLMFSCVLDFLSIHTSWQSMVTLELPMKGWTTTTTWCSPPVIRIMMRAVETVLCLINGAYINAGHFKSGIPSCVIQSWCANVWETIMSQGLHSPEMKILEQPPEMYRTPLADCIKKIAFQKTQVHLKFHY